MQPPDSNYGDGSTPTPYAELVQLSDEGVMEKLRHGNTDAFAVLFSRYHRLVHSVALRIVGDFAEAEDVTQGIFLEIYRKAGQFDASRGTLKVWLLQYAYSRSMNRRNYLLARHFYEHTELKAIDGAASLWSFTRFPQADAGRLTSEVLAGLPDAQRETIKMFFFEGMTLKEIAQKRNESFSNVRHHYYRGLSKLRSLLEGGMPA